MPQKKKPLRTWVQPSVSGVRNLNGTAPSAAAADAEGDLLPSNHAGACTATRRGAAAGAVSKTGSNYFNRAGAAADRKRKDNPELARRKFLQAIPNHAQSAFSFGIQETLSFGAGKDPKKVIHLFRKGGARERADGVKKTPELSGLCDDAKRVLKRFFRPRAADEG